MEKLRVSYITQDRVCESTRFNPSKLDPIRPDTNQLTPTQHLVPFSKTSLTIAIQKYFNLQNFRDSKSINAGVFSFYTISSQEYPSNKKVRLKTLVFLVLLCIAVLYYCENISTYLGLVNL